MRNLLFVILLCTVVSCQKKNSREAVVCVKVGHMTYPKIGLFLNGASVQSELDARGCAEIRVEIPGYAYAHLQYGQDSKLLFLEEGEEVKVSFDGGKFREGILFEGKNASAVDFLNAEAVRYPSGIDYSEEGLKALAVPVAEYKKTLGVKRNEALEMLDAHDLEAVNPLFDRLERERIKYLYAHAWFMYPMGYASVSGDTAFQPGEDYYQVLQEYMVENEELVSVPEYRSFIREAAILFARREGQKVNGYYERLLCNVKYIGEHFINEKVKQPLILIYATEYIDSFGNANTEELSGLCNRYLTDPEWKARYLACCAKE